MADNKPPGPSIEEVDLEKYDYIPATQRPDGTWRPARKVKKGYVPPDEQPKFQTKGSQFRAQQVPGFVPGMDPDEVNAAKEKPKSKNQKRNENKQKKKAEGPGEGDEAAGAAKAAPAAPAEPAAPEDPKEALSKKVRNLKKKVKQTDELQTKVAAGELDPNTEQKDKLAKRGELEAEIKQLEEEMAKL